MYVHTRGLTQIIFNKKYIIYTGKSFQVLKLYEFGSACDVYNMRHFDEADSYTGSYRNSAHFCISLAFNNSFDRMTPGLQFNQSDRRGIIY